MDSKKYHKNLAKHLKGVPLDHKKILKSFTKTYSRLEVNGLDIQGLASQGDETVIQIRYPDTFDASLIPKVYKGLKILRQPAIPISPNTD